jgi:hypothetical protein
MPRILRRFSSDLHRILQPSCTTVFYRSDVRDYARYSCEVSGMAELSGQEEQDDGDISKTGHFYFFTFFIVFCGTESRTAESLSCPDRERGSCGDISERVRASSFLVFFGCPHGEQRQFSRWRQSWSDAPTVRTRALLSAHSSLRRELLGRIVRIVLMSCTNVWVDRTQPKPADGCR